MCKVKIIDSIMGSGKTSFAINHMNEDFENNYVYITPFLAEVKRIKGNCSKRRFREPINFGNGKQDNLHELLANKNNIVSTHALFRASTEITRDLIEIGNYVLILDEVMDVIEQVYLKKDDIPSMINLGLITIDDNGVVIWNEDKLDYDSKYNDIKAMALNKTLIIVNNTMLMWNFPVNIFKSFKEVYVMTYMFKSQIQRYYYDLFSVEYEYFTIDNSNGFKLSEMKDDFDRRTELRKLIKIVDNDSLNSIGDKEFSLSSTWFKRNENNILISVLKNNIYNYFRNVTKAKSKDILWTTFKTNQTDLKGKGYSKGFISCNLRATNEYGDRHYLAYCLNVFLNPIISNYFVNRNVDIDEDGYALSEMLQWIWRSAIRNGENIEIYIPSERMRMLLIQYLALQKC